MKALNYETLKETGYNGYILNDAPVKVLQFGEGNFLRAFVDDFFDIANEKAGWNGKIAVVQPIPQGLGDTVNAQEGLYTLYLRGYVNGETMNERRVISAIKECMNPYEAEDYEKIMAYAASDELEYIVSNTTEAGIVYDPACQKDDCPPSSFPAKLTQVLLRRFEAGKAPLIILSCELIDNNGKELEKCVRQYAEQWGLPAAFSEWLSGCTFCSTLVDRIVTGRIRNPEEKKQLDLENGYEDALIDVGEYYGVWVIEGPEDLNVRLPFRAAGLDENVLIVPDVTPYKKRKVRILNGAHTGMVLGAYLAGFDIVRDCMHDDVIRGFMDKMIREEVMPYLPLERKDVEDFAAAVTDRFLNPFVDHALLSISLNSSSKWKTRNLPSLLAYVEKEGKIPACLAMSLAAFIAFYTCDIQERTKEGLVCRRPAGDLYTVSDDAWVLDFFESKGTVLFDSSLPGQKMSQKEPSLLTQQVLENEKMWGQDLTRVPGLAEAVGADLEMIRGKGAKEAFASCL